MVCPWLAIKSTSSFFIFHFFKSTFIMLACCCAIHEFNKVNFSKSIFFLLNISFTSFLKSVVKVTDSNSTNLIEVCIPSPVTSQSATSNPSNDVPLISPIIFLLFFFEIVYSASTFCIIFVKIHF